jgi:WD40 repeat protein
VEVYHHSSHKKSKNRLVHRFQGHSSSSRGVLFSLDGNQLFSVSSDKSIAIFDGSGSLVALSRDAHEEPVNKICIVPDLPNCIMTGDDGGCVKLWDCHTITTPSLTW